MNRNRQQEDIVLAESNSANALRMHLAKFRDAVDDLCESIRESGKTPDETTLQLLRYLVHSHEIDYQDTGLHESIFWDDEGYSV
jgi:hypothetical protein